MIGQPNFRPHIVEFIRGVGVKIDGVVVQDVGGTGPFLWVVPDDVSVLEDVVVQGGGAGGQGGGDIASPLSLGGGKGGACGVGRSAACIAVTPGSTLTATLGAPGTGGAVNANGTSGGASSLAGLLAGASFATPGTLLCAGGTNDSTALPGASASAVDTVGGGGAAAGALGAIVGSLVGVYLGGAGYNGPMVQGAQGGGGKASSVAGSGGGYVAGTTAGGALTSLDYGPGARAAGTLSGSTSRGGGGGGAASPVGLGRGGNGGSDSAGEGSPGYGGGGGGGSGGFAGSVAGAGYIRASYRSAR